MRACAAVIQKSVDPYDLDPRLYNTRTGRNSVERCASLNVAVVPRIALQYALMFTCLPPEPVVSAVKSLPLGIALSAAVPLPCLVSSRNA